MTRIFSSTFVFAFAFVLMGGAAAHAQVKEYSDMPVKAPTYTTGVYKETVVSEKTYVQKPATVITETKQFKEEEKAPSVYYKPTTSAPVRDSLTIYFNGSYFGNFGVMSEADALRLCKANVSGWHKDKLARCLWGSKEIYRNDPNEGKAGVHVAFSMGPNFYTFSHNPVITGTASGVGSFDVRLTTRDGKFIAENKNVQVYRGEWSTTFNNNLPRGSYYLEVRRNVGTAKEYQLERLARVVLVVSTKDY